MVKIKARHTGNIKRERAGMLGRHNALCVARNHMAEGLVCVYRGALMRGLGADVQVCVCVCVEVR